MDHLHIRGEHEKELAKDIKNEGSPPHTWRTRGRWHLTTSQMRITSTYVENTVSAYCWKNGFKDHLHIRGEHLAPAKSVSYFIGSPPHTWRTRIEGLPTTLQDRITSTYVENTQPLNRLHGRKRDHLHIRGEHFNGSFNF